MCTSDGKLRRLGEALWRRDPAADEFVEASARLPPGVGFQELTQALRTGSVSPTAPSALRELLGSTSPLPAWVDERRVRSGGAVLLRAGPAAGIVLGMKSLVLGYASPGGNKPLALSGRLRAHTVRRLAETSRFVQAVSQPLGMQRHAAGFAITTKVRVMHAQVRRLIDHSEKWQPQLWGQPINQHDMVATVILFSAALVEGLRALGYQVTEREAEDVLHLWRHVGWVMGVEEALLPTSHADALATADLIQATQGAPDADSRALVAALFNARLDNATTAAKRRAARHRTAFMQGICRKLIGDRLADQLGVARGPWPQLASALRPALAVAARLGRLPLWRQVALVAGDRYWDLAVGKAQGDEYPPPARLEPARS